jgi:anti-anti-sigma factor
MNRPPAGAGHRRRHARKDHIMSPADYRHIRPSMVDDVVLVEVLSKDLLGPELALELSVELSSLVAQEGVKRILIDFHRTAYLSSTGFAVLFKLVNEVKSSGRQIKFCEMHKDVRIGADIVGLGRVVEFHDSKKEALKTFSHE